MTVAHAEHCPSIAAFAPGGQRWYVTGHATERYRERWEPYLTLAEAQQKLVRLVFAASLRWAPSPDEQRWHVEGVPDLVLIVSIDRPRSSLVLRTVIDTQTMVVPTPRARRSA